MLEHPALEHPATELGTPSSTGGNVRRGTVTRTWSGSLSARVASMIAGRRSGGVRLAGGRQGQGRHPHLRLYPRSTATTPRRRTISGAPGSCARSAAILTWLSPCLFGGGQPGGDALGDVVDACPLAGPRRCSRMPSGIGSGEAGRVPAARSAGNHELTSSTGVPSSSTVSRRRYTADAPSPTPSGGDPCRHPPGTGVEQLGLRSGVA
jgi:hypothetical protein